MNRAHVTYICIYLLFATIHIFGQEHPPIQNYSTEDYEAANQNWAIDQAEDKTMYFANNAGLLEFNGAEWNLYPTSNGSIMRSIKVIDDLIYSGSYMDFGYWKKNELGKLEYTSLAQKLKTSLAEDEEFWDILNLDEYVLFQSFDRIYIYNVTTESFNTIDAENLIEIFKVGNQIYFQKSTEGLFSIKNGKPTLVSNHQIFKNKHLAGAFQRNGNDLFLTQSGEFYVLKNSILELWEIEAQEELKSRKIYCSSLLNDGSFMLGTIADGFIQLSPDGAIIANVNKEDGLFNNTILSVFEDVDGNVWFGLDNGISVLNFNSSFKVYSDFSGNLGIVYTSIVFGDFMYLGTNQGLFYKEINSREKFKLIENTEGQVWTLKVIQNTLFCGHNSGTYIIENNKAELIADLRGTWDIKEINDENFLIQGNYEGLSILQKKNNAWQFRNKIEGFDISSRFFELLGADQILVNHEMNGVYTLTLNSDFTKVISLKNQGAYGFGSSLVRFNNEILYSINSISSIFKYDELEQKFDYDSIGSKIFYGKEDASIGPLLVDNQTQKLWGFGSKRITYYGENDFSDKMTENTIPISEAFRRNLGLVGFENLNHFKDNTYLIGSTNGYALLDIDKLKLIDNTIKINSITKESRNGEAVDLSLSNTISLEHFENNLRISFSIPDFNKLTDTQYQYNLEGFYDTWSDWQNEAYVNFGNLPHGTYNFKVRGKVGNSLSNNTETFQFVILKPWYLTNAMIAAYILIFIAVFIGVNRALMQYYARERNRAVKRTYRKLRIENLEKEQELLKSKNDNLQLDVDNKNRELGISTMNLIKKNEILNNIKKELSHSDSASHIKYVIKLIDKNLNDDDDWKLFEEAFNNADKDFFKKIKQLHPTLTPNDLKLCAYLRLNLASKEIAPLLNISVKSVEVKRYRLRKKMNLSQEANLSKYIFEV